MCDGQNNYFQVSKVVEGFMLYTYSFRKKVGFLCGAPQNNDFAERICDESKKLPQMVGFLCHFDLVFGFKGLREDMLKILIYV